jgi:DNA-binding MarR family transcriptional regulator
VSSGPTLSRYTPSLMGRDLLERLFVVRDRLLDEIIRRIEAAARTTERNHTLLVGPRGAGKTHLVALAYHRTKDLMGEGRRLQVAWLPEDPWTLVTYRHVLTEIVSRLEPPFEGDVPRHPAELEAVLAQRATDLGPAVVIVENLDQILQAIGNDGQQRLRHLLQTDRSLLLVATSTTLDRSMSDQASPFYGFFTTSRLEPFDVEEAAAMLTAIAREREDDELVEYLASAEGKARLRTIEHLAGGQPRMWAALASALTVDGLDDLVDLLLTRFDDLTPYYQEQLGRLSGQQRLVVAELAEVDRPITVKELAERLEIDQRSLGKTVSDLVERRWMAETTSPVTAMLDQRRTYYELAEPMARLSFQIKDNRGEPLRVIVDFLKHWFDPVDLTSADALADVVRVGERVGTYLRAASIEQDDDAVIAAVRRLSGLPESGGRASPVLAEIDGALHALGAASGERFLCLPAAVRSAVEGQLEDRSFRAVQVDVHHAALSEVGDGFLPVSMVSWVERALRLAAQDGDGDGDGDLPRQVILLRWLAKAGRLDEAREMLRSLPVPAGPSEALDICIAKIEVANRGTDVGEVGMAARLYGDVLEAFDAWPDLLGLPMEGLTDQLLANRDRLRALEERLQTSITRKPWVDAVVARLPGAFAVAGATAEALVGAARHADAARLRAHVAEASQSEWGLDDPRSIAAREAAARG